MFENSLLEKEMEENCNFADVKPVEPYQQIRVLIQRTNSMLISVKGKPNVVSWTVFW